MKLMVVAPYFYPKIGGMENYAWNISKGLKDKYGWEIIVITSNHEEKQDKIETISGIKIYRLSYWFKLSNTPINPYWFFQIKKIIKKEKPDIINAHTPVPFISDITALVKNKIPYVLTYQNDLVKDSKLLNTICKAYYFFLGNFTLKSSHNIITSSELYAKTSPYLKTHSNKIKVIYPGVNINNNRNKKSELINKQKEKTVLFVGQLDKTHSHKGLDYLIKAILQVSSKIDNVRLLVIGKGNYIDHYKNLAQKIGVDKKIDFLGFVSDDIISKYYNLSDVVVLPSYNEAEGFGMVLIEAGVFKKPVIGTNVGGIGFVIDHNKTGLLVEPKNSEQLANAIIKILMNEELAKQFGENGYEKVINNFTWDRQIKKTHILFNSL